MEKIYTEEIIKESYRITENSSEIITKGISRFGVLLIAFEKKSYRLDLLKKTMEYWEKYTKEHHLKMIFIYDTLVMHGNHKDFEKLGYLGIKGEIDKHVKNCMYYKPVAKGVTRRFIHKSKEVMNFLSSLKEKEKLFAYGFGSSIRMEKIHIYYRGFKGFIRCTYDQKMYFTIGDEGEKYYINSEKDIQGQLESIFQKIEMMMRLKNIYEPPCYFFKKNTHYIIPSQHINHVFQTLLKKYSWEEIETYMADADIKELRKKKMTRSGIELVGVMDHFFVINGEDSSHFENEQKQQAFDYFVQLIQQKESEKIKEEFTNTFQKEASN